MNAYKSCEKKWKGSLADARSILKSDKQLIDLEKMTPEQEKCIEKVGEFAQITLKKVSKSEQKLCPVLSLKKFGTSHEGFYVIPAAINQELQLEIAKRCL